MNDELNENPEISSFVDIQKEKIEEKLQKIRDDVIRAVDFALYQEVLDILEKSLDDDNILGKHCDFSTLLNYTTGEAVKSLLQAGRFDDADAAAAKFGIDMEHMAGEIANKCMKGGENLIAEEIAERYGLQLKDQPEISDDPVAALSASIIESVKKSIKFPPPLTYTDIKKEQLIDPLMESLIKYIVTFCRYRSSGDFEEFIEEFAKFGYEQNIDQKRLAERLFAYLAEKGNYNLIEPLLEDPYDFPRIHTNISMCMLRGYLKRDTLVKIAEEVFDYLRGNFEFGKALLLSKKYGIRKSEAEEMKNEATNTGCVRKIGVRVSGGSIMNHETNIDPSEIAKYLKDEVEQLVASRNFYEAKIIADEFGLGSEVGNRIKSFAEKWLGDIMRPLMNSHSGVDPRMMASIYLGHSIGKSMLRAIYSLDITHLEEEEKDIILLRSIGVLMRAGYFGKVDELIRELDLKENEIRNIAEVVLKEGTNLSVDEREFITREYLKKA